MNQTNRADAAAKYLESLGFPHKAEAVPEYEFVYKSAMPSEPLWRTRAKEKRLERLAKLPRMRFVNNLGVWRLTGNSELPTVVYANDMETAYFDWLEVEANRNADEYQGDLSLCCYEDSLPIPNLKTLGWLLLGLLIVFALAALYCVFHR
jgi:hypothetical protein